MNTAFLVQNNYVQPLTIPVAGFAREHGFSLEDRSSFQGFNPDSCGIDWTQYDVVIPYGSVQFLRQCKDSSIGKFVLHDEELFAASHWMPILGDLSLNHKGYRTDAGDVTRLLESGESYHLRPDRIDKAFPGGVFDLLKWRQVTDERKLDSKLDCWVTPVQDIQAEWRCWVVNGSVLSISKYREDSKMAVVRETSEEVLAAATTLAGIYVPAPCVVLDIAKTSDGYSVIEFNPIHCSGWYGADVATVLKSWVKWSEDNLLSKKNHSQVKP